MRRPAHVFALCAVDWLAVACQTSAERCNDHPDDPGCIPDAGTVGGLTWRTIQQEVGDGWADVELGLCGAFIREVVWLMPDGAPADGFVVQQIDIETTGVCPVPPESPLLDTCTDPPSVDHLPAHCVEDGAPFIDRGGIRF